MRRPMMSMETVVIPAGYFYMGVANVTALTQDETEDVFPCWPERRVHVKAFRIGRFPVTNQEYREFVRACEWRLPIVRGLEWASCWQASEPYFRDEHANRPVVFVSYRDAKVFCQWLGGRLPSEAEWEKACRGTDRRPFPWGDDNNIKLYGNFETRSTLELVRSTACESLTDVNSHPAGASPYGCEDMLGNVEEWCADWYLPDWYPLLPDSQLIQTKRGLWKSVRGCGRFGSTVHACYRSCQSPSERNWDLGFRVVFESLS